jgi:GxxExxY protein
MSELLFRDESFRIVSACFEVYNQKGFGFTEPIYQECLRHEFLLQRIPFLEQPRIPMIYKGIEMEQFFVPDFICFDKIVVELKSVSQLTDAHRAQTLNYLHACELDLGILINFGQYPKLKYERLVRKRRNGIEAAES